MLGHLNYGDLLEISKKKAVYGFDLEKDKNPVICKVCLEAKLTALPFLDKVIKSNQAQETRPYQELIGTLNYLAIATRLDISHIVNCLSQLNTSYNEDHWKAVKRVLRYLKWIINFGITYIKGRTGRYL